ncbi:MAG TPA: 23S rRNA (guanosine(2251)-2'-O)-methyltransferase RlmB [Burkholderiales bacterium]|nr:23S rRNA (guanosine(2251)-2'-O)-methyltransferase RlmB [Burkholderiales bacterium]
MSRLIYGLHAVTACVRRNAKSIKEIYVDEIRRDRRMNILIALAESRGVRVIAVERKRLDGMTRHARHQNVVAKTTDESQHLDLDELLDALTEPALLLVLDGIQDPHNLGACLRVADASGVQAVIAPKDRAVGMNPTVLKVACGAAETVPYFAVTNLVRTLHGLKERKIWIIGADNKAKQDLFSANLSGPIAWVLGAEDAGLRRLTKETCDELVRIPMAGSIESLNVSVASGICLFETKRQRAAKNVVPA